MDLKTFRLARSKPYPIGSTFVVVAAGVWRLATGPLATPLALAVTLPTPRATREQVRRIGHCKPPAALLGAH